MPLVVAEHEHRRIEPWFWGLLPDNEPILQRWAQRFQVSAQNAFALLEHVGEDCASAAQLARPKRAEMLHDESAGAIEWLDFDYKKLRLAMRIGRVYLIDDIGPRQRAALAERARLSPGHMRERCLAMINALPDAAAAVARSSRAEGLRHPIIGRLAEAISKHAKRCLRSLDAGKPASS